MPEILRSFIDKVIVHDKTKSFTTSLNIRKNSKKCLTINYFMRIMYIQSKYKEYKKNDYYKHKS